MTLKATIVPPAEAGSRAGRSRQLMLIANRPLLGYWLNDEGGLTVDRSVLLESATVRGLAIIGSERKYPLEGKKIVRSADATGGRPELRWRRSAMPGREDSLRIYSRQTALTRSGRT